MNKILESLYCEKMTCKFCNGNGHYTKTCFALKVLQGARYGAFGPETRHPVMYHPTMNKPIIHDKDFHKKSKIYIRAFMMDDRNWNDMSIRLAIFMQDWVEQQERRTLPTGMDEAKWKGNYSNQFDKERIHCASAFRLYTKLREEAGMTPLVSHTKKKNVLKDECKKPHN